MRATRHAVNVTMLVATLGLAACQGEPAPSGGLPAGANDATAASASNAAGAPPVDATTADAAKQRLSGRTWSEIGAEAPMYEQWARILATYVDDEGLIDYAGVAGAGRADLDGFMQTLATIDPSGLGEAEQIAFWINAYNALVVYQVAERYPLESVRDVGALFGLVGGFFKQEYQIANRTMTLDNIEHDVLRPTYNDARIHWTLVCAAFGCPRLIQRPYVAADLDPLLTELSYEFLANPRALFIDAGNDTLYVSSYFDWYGADFEAEAGDVISYILQYATGDKATWIEENRDVLRLRFMDYDWTLNDQPQGPRSRRPVDPT